METIREDYGGTIGGLRRLLARPLVETEGGTLGNKRLPLYDFHRSFRLSWDDTESLVRRSCYYVDYEALWGKVFLVASVPTFTDLFGLSCENRVLSAGLCSR